MSPDHPSYSQTNKWRGGLKFLLPTFKAHGRNSSLIEVKGERRESRGWAKGSTGQLRNAAALESVVLFWSVLICTNLIRSPSWRLLSLHEWVGDKSSVFMSLCPLESHCLNLSHRRDTKLIFCLDPITLRLISSCVVSRSKSGVIECVYAGVSEPRLH